jgi:predicted permease
VLRVFLDVVLPVALVALVGALVGRLRGVPVEPLSALVFYLFSPALVFTSMASTQVPAGVSLRILGVMVGTFAVMLAAATAWSLARRHDARFRASFALGATTPNSGNMGLPVAQLAFGDAGLQLAIVNFVAGATLANTAGIVVASMAGGSRSAALRAPLRAPYIYATLAGLAVNALDVRLPIAISAPAESLAVAAVPCMLVVLGLQLQTAGRREDVGDTVAANAMRLLIAPAAAWVVASALGLEGVERATLVVLAAMPTAVIATILATEYGARPAFVTRVVVTSTLASMATLTGLIALVR